MSFQYNYVPQQGRSEEEKREFLEKLSDSIHDQIIYASGGSYDGDIKCHIGSTDHSNSILHLQISNVI